MPRPGSSRTLGAYNGSGGRPHVGLSAEETTGIAILAIIAALVLIIGCWYFKRRNGYKILKGMETTSWWLSWKAPRNRINDLELVLHYGFLEVSKDPDEVEKHFLIGETHHFSPAAIRSMMGASRDTGECKVPLQDYNTLNNVVPGAPPAYEKIAGETRPPPYTP
ncbi:unnamed protein product [Ranitomeya imitator]|uniref:Melanoma antigen recognized by T-cells 1 n=1 Tax=Ranitomeya imitator TaxID=111125 RepID=A0ABN9LQU2_9NEOB|nr:unnamed protein product [Ranitomeya imitator]